MDKGKEGHPVDLRAPGWCIMKEFPGVPTSGLLRATEAETCYVGMWTGKAAEHYGGPSGLWEDYRWCVSFPSL